MEDRVTFKAAVHLFLIQKEQILLLRRFNTGWQDGNYSVIAGHMDGNETTVGAMVREALEEGGITIKEDDLRVMHTMHRMMNDAEYFDFFLSTDSWDGIPTICEPNKCDDLSWFPLSDLPQNTIPYIRLALNNILAGRPFSELDERTQL